MKKGVILYDSIFLLVTLLLILVIVPSSLALHQGQVHDADRDGVPDEDLNNDGIPDDRCQLSQTTDVDQFGCDCQQKTSSTCLISFPGINCCVPDNNPCTDDCGKGEITYATCNVPNNAPCQNGYCSGGRCVLQVNRQRSSQNSATNQNPSTTAANPSVASQNQQSEVSAPPIPQDAFCFYYANRNNPRCSRYYRRYSNNEADFVCPQYFNPVYAADGTFYPSACWAEALGANTYSYGYSPALLRFFSEEWSRQGFNVPHPNIEFRYQGSGLVTDQSGISLRSTYWSSTSSYSVLGYDIYNNRETENGRENIMTSEFTQAYTMNILIPSINSNPRILLIYITFDNAYPQELLLSMTPTYGRLMNDYIRKKQAVPNPIHYSIIPVIIPPPPGVTNHVFNNDEIQSIFNAAIQVAGSSNFEVIVIAPIKINGFGGYPTEWNNRQLLIAPLSPPAPYSATDKKAGLDSIAAIQQMFITLSHEVLHSVGLQGDHMPMGYGTYFLDWTGALEIDPITGRQIETSETPCDFLGRSPDYYPVELPQELRIIVGSEPQGLVRETSSSGDCVSGLNQNERLKDFDRDGEYEIMYKNNLIGIELQRTLGWVDVDGDGITELIDPTPYGRSSAVVTNPPQPSTPPSCELNLPSSVTNGQEFTATWNGPGNSMEVRTLFNGADGIHNRNERLITANNFLYPNLPVSGTVEGLRMHAGAAVTVIMNWKDANGNVICGRTSIITAQPNSAAPQLIVNPSQFYQGDVVNVRVNNVQSGQTIYLHVNGGNGVPLGTATGSTWERIFQSHETRFTPGTYSIAVSAGGIQSAPVQVTISPR